MGYAKQSHTRKITKRNKKPVLKIKKLNLKGLLRKYGKK